MSAPKAPDPVRTAQAQTQSNIQTGVANTIMGNANETNPYGSVTYNQIGTTRVGNQDIPQYSRTVTLSPEQQRLYDQQTQLGYGLNSLAIDQTNRLSDTLGRPISSEGLPGAPQSLNLQTGVGNSDPALQGRVANSNPALQSSVAGSDPSLARMQSNSYEQSRKAVENALYSRLNPQIERDRAALATRLSNQGVTQGSEAWNREMDALGRNINDARQQVVLAGGQEQSRLAGLDQSRLGFNNAAVQQELANRYQAAQFGNQAQQQGLANRYQAADLANQTAQQRLANRYQAAQFGNAATQEQAAYAQTARDRALQEQLALRNQPINEISALMSGGQVTAPQFAQYRPGNIAGTDIAGLIQQNYANQSKQYGAMLGGLAGLGGSLLMAPMTGGTSLGGMMGGGLASGLGGMFGGR